MNIRKWIVFALGLVIIMLAVPLGNGESILILRLAGGSMDTSKYVAILDGCIRGFQIFGAMISLYGIWGIYQKK